MDLSPNKSFFMLFGVKDEFQTDLVSNTVTIKISIEENVLGTTITSNNERNFKLQKNIYNLRNFHLFESQNPRTKQYSLDCIAYTASQL